MWQDVADLVQAYSAFINVLILIITFFIAVRQGKYAGEQAMLLKNIELRLGLINDANHNDMQRKISHKDNALERLLRKINSAADPCAAAGLTEDEQRLRQKLDNYLNYLETVGLLLERKWFRRHDAGGFWDYYFQRLGAWQPLKQYISHPEFLWGDLAGLCNGISRSSNAVSV
ncbi:hypothetical protein [Lacipirellula parvula]|uniref:Uncharacterized protein n=1 Tax=Lacipirellula parvula TaxID=2650471 RepID=A0A5K7X6E1_9BACT|nr:hypothetical protein [Lacipirellula parvula]BBO32098.1 hypothetical protein PLANPX_1710 [Lacipirellula parvula]